MKNSIIYLLIFSIFSSCANSGNQNTDSSKHGHPQEIAEGLQLAENNCFSCHSPDASYESRIAPPMAAIKKHYLEGEVSEEQFTKDLIAFMNDPSEEISKMPKAIERFNLMPKMNMSEEQISSIASFMYHSKLEEPDWFEEHYQKERQKYQSALNQSPLETGQSFAMKTKGVLGKNLLGAINSGGTEHAISFCSARAISLTDSMAVALSAQIKRVSDKNRNPGNKANETELAYIEKTREMIASGKQPKPQLMPAGNKLVGYYPIMTGKMCLQCHGQPDKEVLPGTLSKIKSLYPDDKATGYKVNELRGIWVVEMDQRSVPE